MTSHERYYTSVASKTGDGPLGVEQGLRTLTPSRGFQFHIGLGRTCAGVPSSERVVFVIVVDDYEIYGLTRYVRRRLWVTWKEK